jgi:large subunit ribosomal protein L4
VTGESRQPRPTKAVTVPVRTVDGTVTGWVRLDGDYFGLRPNVELMHQVVTAQLAAARSGTQSTKTRAEVRGGGKKPFRQKGTGRARQGSTRAPHWTGGGVALGPKPRSYKQRTPRKMIQQALRCALSDRAAEGRVAVVAEWPWTAPKTAHARQALVDLGLDGRTLVVLDRLDNDDADKSFRNLPTVQVIRSGELNVYDVLCNDWVVFTRATLPGEVVDTDEPGEGTDAVEIAEGADAVDTPSPAATEVADATPATAATPEAADATETEPPTAGDQPPAAGTAEEKS